jgi:hypothetical protein
LKFTAEGIIDAESKSVFDTIRERYILQDSLAIIMAHCGAFSQDLVNSLGLGAEEILIASNEKRPMIRKIFSVLIEGLQNIKVHGEANKGNIKSGILVLAKGTDCYKISFGNLILNDLITAMKERLNELNLLDEMQLKESYMQVLSERILSNQGGAGLGFITMRMKAKSQLNFHFEKVSAEKSVFTFELIIKRLTEREKR